MHTTEEAKGLWCPMVRVGVLPSHGGPSGVSDPTTEFHGTCIAAACAMWRWDGKVVLPVPRQADTWWPEEDEPQTEPARQVKVQGNIVHVPADAVWLPMSGEGDNVEGGYWVESQEKVDAENAAAKASAMASMRGYCGLAGKGID